MHILRESIVSLAGTLCLGWAAVFVCYAYDKIRGRATLRFFGPGHRHLPKFVPLKWWQRVIYFPLYCVAIPALLFCFAIFLPPAFVVEKIWKVRKKPGGDSPNQSTDPTFSSGTPPAEPESRHP
jgi:hypothetical protein